MNPREVTEEPEHPGARTLLDSATLLRLAYNGSDGFPRAIPIGFHWNGSRIVVCTAADGLDDRCFDGGGHQEYSSLTRSP